MRKYELGDIIWWGEAPERPRRFRKAPGVSEKSQARPMCAPSREFVIGHYGCGAFAVSLLAGTESAVRRSPGVRGFSLPGSVDSRR
jgi:hypothetical protein